MMKLLALAGTALIALAPISVASAAAFDFVVGGPVTGSGSFEATSNGDDSFTISDISGTFDGDIITGLISFEGNDNQLFPSSNPQLSFNGVSFATAENNYNLFYNSDFSSYRLITNADGSANLSVTFNATPASGAVPEPATWAMMIGGIGIAGGAMRRRRGVMKTTVRFA